MITKLKIELSYKFLNEAEKNYMNENFPHDLSMNGTIEVTYNQLKMFKELLKKPNSKIIKIYNTCLDYFNKEHSENQKRENVIVRQIAHFICVEKIIRTDKNKFSNEKSMYLNKIGSFIGGKNRTTVLYSHRVISDLLSYDKKLKSDINEILNILEL